MTDDDDDKWGVPEEPEDTITLGELLERLAKQEATSGFMYFDRLPDGARFRLPSWDAPDAPKGTRDAYEGVVLQKRGDRAVVVEHWWPPEIGTDRAVFARHRCRVIS